MSDFKTRLIDEKQQLDDKVGKLSAFTQTAAFKEVPLKQQNLLNMQLPVMQAYSLILGERLSLLE